MGKAKRPDNLSGDIEREVRQTLDEVAATLREVGQQLNQDENIRRTVHQVGDAARSGIAAVRENVRNGISAARKDVRGSMDAARADMRASGEAARADVRDSLEDALAAARAPQGKKKKQKRRKRIDYAKKAKGAMYPAFGYFVSAALMGICAGEAGPYETGGVLCGLLCAGFLAAAVYSLINGLQLRRIAMYQRVLGDRAYCTVKELSEMTEQRPRAVRSDLRRLIRQGKYEGVYLAPDATLLFSSEMAYRLYMAHEAELAAAEAAEAEQVPEPAAEEQPEIEEPTVLEDCRTFLRDLRDQQRLITDAAVLSETQRIESETQNILMWLEKHPDGAGQIRRFASYYMPTTLKLLKTYNEVTPQAQSSSVAAEIQADICTILGTVQTAFQNLQNNLLKDTALDVSAEISALETVLAQDGLTKDGLLP